MMQLEYSKLHEIGKELVKHLCICILVLFKSNIINIMRIDHFGVGRLLQSCNPHIELISVRQNSAQPASKPFGHGLEKDKTVLCAFFADALLTDSQ